MDVVNQQSSRPGQNFVKFTASFVVLAAALLTVTLAVPALEHFGGNDLALGSGDWAKDVRGFVQNPLAYFARRSPGGRDSRDLIQSKNRAAPLVRPAPKPHEQVLSNVRYVPPIPPYVLDLVPGPGPDLIDYPLPGPDHLPPPGGPIPPPVIVPPVVFPPTTTPGGTPGGNTGVPEPSTWFMLIWGMALVGFGLRSQHRQLAPN